MAAVLVATGAVALLSAVVVATLWASSSARRLSRRRVLVHTRDGQSLEGMLMRSYRDGLVLATPRHLDEQVDVGGEVFMPADNVSWLQVLGGER